MNIFDTSDTAKVTEITLKFGRNAVEIVKKNIKTAKIIAKLIQNMENNIKK